MADTIIGYAEQGSREAEEWARDISIEWDRQWVEESERSSGQGRPGADTEEEEDGYH